MPPADADSQPPPEGRPGRADPTADFDTFYKDTRDRLLLQTWALTGDLTAARSAVRHAYTVAWHHWRKVARREDPESWLRPHAWAYAERRHTARLGHRDKDLDPEVRETLDTLAALPATQRRVLLLSLLAPVPLDDLAREVGLPRKDAEHELQAATAAFSVQRGVPSTDIRALLEPLAEAVKDVRWPRSTIVRRAGTGRRRAYTAAAVLVTVATLLISGMVVSDGGVPATLDRAATPQRSDDDGDRDDDGEEPPPLSADALLTAKEVQKRVKGTGWRDLRTDGNTEGDGIVLPCQADRYADPRGTAALLRVFEARRRGGPRRTAWQLAEASRNERAARRAFRTSVGWYAACPEPRLQLLSTRRIGKVGDQAMLLALRSWSRPVRTTVVGVARTGSLTTTTVLRVGNDARPDIKGGTALLAESVRKLCTLPDGGSCVGRPDPQLVRPVAVGEQPSLLSEIDLPPVRRVAAPWTGSPVVKANTNPASTPCDRTTFTGRGMRNNVTRTFVILNAGLPTQFGLTETVGSLGKKKARAFVDGVRRRIARCAQDDLTTEVRRLANTDTRRRDLTVWVVTTEVSDKTTVRYLMAVLRSGTTVAQLGFVPAGARTMSDADFVGLARRALERLPEHPAP
ncbi:hypothetical protein [Nocardioides marmotae]|uniref:RNA polymerase sigma factor 70 region 4 type 2 domain-containing protein n=1 Tax=Nocardioides marmotae TaxID=2663857 RepID=A0A6I3J9V1_9ACTN|nr:hypothetical protein [Nocardioides marmotae]MCR6031291.1 hypothetical protein [Gordonia jinghuaiqii]MBC9733690.1 hypothetical protein [Nocardioides marmotae]MTB84793.1 hypothetical protein [Nocardioides marmotae]MTB94930.1 hypothetical protein [Nocardioides marmotae]QKE02558.1 hypothetical protein HPC71_16900 [Nocardioides marmotae]